MICNNILVCNTKDNIWETKQCKIYKHYALQVQ